MKKTRPKPYITEDNSSLLYIINPKAIEKRTTSRAGSSSSSKTSMELPRTPHPWPARRLSQRLQHRRPPQTWWGFTLLLWIWWGFTSNQATSIWFFELHILNLWPLHYSLPLNVLLLHKFLCRKVLGFPRDRGEAARKSPCDIPKTRWSNPLKPECDKGEKMGKEREEVLIEFSSAQKWQRVKDGRKERRRAPIYRHRPNEPRPSDSVW